MKTILQAGAWALLGLALLPAAAWAAADDVDGDGVADAGDQCPDSRAGTLIDPRGCAAEIPPMPTADEAADATGIASAPAAVAPAPVTPAATPAPASMPPALRKLSFEAESFKLGADNRRILDGIYASLRREPQLRLEIIGHADSAERYGRRLAQARAAAARAFLVDLGIDGSRLKDSSAGSKSPLAGSDSEGGRALNRRVELRALPQ
ncbi:MAG TPA: OmpA family protein [Solimonas sp.]|nr:OmpA family protein [Solimonas sp.]